MQAHKAYPQKAPACSSRASLRYPMGTPLQHPSIAMHHCRSAQLAGCAQRIQQSVQSGSTCTCLSQRRFMHACISDVWIQPTPHLEVGRLCFHRAHHKLVPQHINIGRWGLSNACLTSLNSSAWAALRWNASWGNTSHRLQPAMKCSADSLHTAEQTHDSKAECSTQVQQPQVSGEGKCTNPLAALQSGYAGGLGGQLAQ